MSDASLLVGVFNRQRWVIVGALIAVTLLGWLYLFFWPMPMPGVEGVATFNYIALSTAMWAIMMIAMMTPSVAPVVMLFDRISQRGGTLSSGRTSLFVTGYFTAWSGFSVLATLLQVVLVKIGIVDTMGVTQQPTVAALLCAVVGVYQWLPAKTACLEHCRSPIEFLTSHYRPQLFGAWRMGLEHGVFCIGCCWLLMLLLFVGGVMNLAWVAAITVVVALEKLFPRADVVRRITGVCLLVGSAVIVFSAR